MADEQETIVTAAPETPTSEATTETREAPAEVKDEPIDTGEAETETEAVEEPEFVNVERNGKSFKVPKELEGEFLMQSDYTKKTQGVAERDKALTEREQRLTQQAEATEAELDARAGLRTVNKELERLKTYDFAAYQQHRMTDPMAAEEVWNYIQHLRGQKTELEGVVSKAQTERTEKAQQSLAKRVQETLAEAPKIIPGWKPDTGSQAIEKLVQFGHSLGIPEQAMKDNWSPALLKLLHRASIGEQSLQKAAAPPPKAPPAEAVVPLTTVSAKNAPAARVSLAQLAKEGRMEEYAAARRAGRVR